MEVEKKDKEEETEQESTETTEPVKKSVNTFKKQKTDHPCSFGDTKETPSERTKRKTVSPAEDDRSEVKSKKRRVSLSYPSISGRVFVMGENNVGQLGFGLEIEERKRPTLLDLPYSIISIAAGGMHSVCLTENGEVITFGCNDEGALGRVAVNGDEVVSPGRVEINERVIEISAGDSHSAALTEYGEVYLWGNFRNRNGKMGLTSDGVEQRRPIKILNNFQIVKISSGADHLACLSIDGIVYTCGCGQNGQLGRLTKQECHDDRPRELAAFLEPAAVPVRVFIEDIWTSNDSTFLKAQETGLIYVFGLNNYHQIGFGNVQAAYAPTVLTTFNIFFNSILSWKEISGGQHHTLSLDSYGHVYSMGCQNYGRLGLGYTLGHKSSPTLITSLKNEKCCTISCGDDVSFAITEEGSLYSWGNGQKHQLGHGNDNDCDVPCLVEGNFAKFWKALKVSGGGQHTLILAIPKENIKSDI